MLITGSRKDLHPLHLPPIICPFFRQNDPNVGVHPALVDHCFASSSDESAAAPFSVWTFLLAEMISSFCFQPHTLSDQSLKGLSVFDRSFSIHPFMPFLFGTDGTDYPMKMRKKTFFRIFLRKFRGGGTTCSRRY